MLYIRNALGATITLFVTLTLVSSLGYWLNTNESLSGLYLVYMIIGVSCSLFSWFAWIGYRTMYYLAPRGPEKMDRYLLLSKLMVTGTLSAWIAILFIEKLVARSDMLTANIIFFFVLTTVVAVHFFIIQPRWQKVFEKRLDRIGRP